MKKLIIIALASTLLLTGCNEQSDNESPSQKDKSYAYGYRIGTTLRDKDAELDLNAFKSGVKDGINNSSKFSDQELASYFAALEQEISEKYQSKMQAERIKNLQESDAFLEANKSKEGIVSLDSGLQYKVIRKGTGKRPTESDQVRVHYAGTLINGEEFDSSYSRGEPLVFGVTQVIPGWTEALKLMPVGSKWQLFIPPHLGYGPQGTRGAIGPNMALIFEVELLEIVK